MFAEGCSQPEFTEQKILLAVVENKINLRKLKLFSDILQMERESYVMGCIICWESGFTAPVVDERENLNWSKITELLQSCNYEV